MPLSTAGGEITAREALYGLPPTLEGRRVRVMDTSLLGFQGLATLSDYVKLHLGPISLALRDFVLVMIIVTAAGYGLGALIRGQWWAKRVALAAWTISSVLIFILILGVEGAPSLPVVSMERWGGLLLTVTLTVVGIVAAFPIGVLLALGRRSELPVVRIFCTLAIELVRGVPLVTILFMASLLVPLLDPRLSSVDNVIRAMFGITFFSAAYLAEIVRGGLQAVPYGQTEAAKALGMPGWQIIALIVLPQALRAVIPAIMGQFVSLFKDTSLVLIIGLLDLLGIARSVINQAEYIGLQRETLVFISVIYFVMSYLMSWVSRRLEATGSGVVRRG
ncbi:MAG: amino acid ABC transporter permease [Anaerolineae bacterium]|nr:amino acid ABC transporter permease [Anaerolineae bacterium]